MTDLPMTDLPPAQEHTSDIQLLLDIADLYRIRDLDELLRAMLNTVNTAFDALNSSLLLFDGERISWHYVVTRNEPVTRSKSYMRVIMEKGLAGWTFRNREIGLVHDTKTDPRWHHNDDHNKDINSALCVPLIYQDDVLAVLSLLHTEAGHFTHRHVELMTIIASQVAVAIHNTRTFQQLQFQQRQMEKIIEVLPDYLLVLDNVGRIVVANDQMMTLFHETDRSRVLGKSLGEIPQRDDSLEEAIELLIESLSQPVMSDLSFQTRSTQLERDFQVMLSRWHGDDGQVAGYVLAMYDVSQIHDLYSFKDQMLRIVSHDLRSPIAMIIGYGEMIKMDTPPDHETLPEFTDAILRSAERMDRLLQDLLNVERLRSGPLDLHETVNPKELVDDVVAHGHRAAREKGIQFGAQTNIDFDNTFVLADRVLIRQTMENLINNAIKYTEPGGKIAVISRYDFDKRRFHFAVADTGMGIDEEKLPHVFESFYRVQRPEMAGIQGSGLGLSLVKNVIEQHKGKVWVKSKVNKGSKFGFWLPLVDVEEPSASATHPEAS